ncbi:MAG: conjugal transfer protein TrbI [Chlorobiaceae bacterium]|nr:conjugal transfer protein TrbI [Chlorobiaceae bacterium]
MVFGRKKRSVRSDRSVGSEGMAGDVHASKIPTDDPRLWRPAVKGRRLRKGPVFALGTLIMSIIVVALTVAIWPKDKTKATKKEDVPLNQIFTIPDNIRKGPGNDAPLMVGPARTTDNPETALLSGQPSAVTAESAIMNARNAMARQTAYNGISGGYRQDPEENEKQAAIMASPFFGGNGNSRPNSENTPSSLLASLTGSQQNNAQTDTNAFGRGGQNMQDRKNDFFSNGSGDEKEYVSKAAHAPLSKYEIKAGSVIPVILVTAINSDLPGNVVAMVSEDVYDSRTGDYLLIPKGTRVLGRYDSMVSYGQSRVQVNWNRIVRPDGSSILLDNMPGVDLAGNSGYKDRVDNHFDRLAGGVILSSLLSVGASVSQGAYTDESSMTMQQRMAANVGENLNNVGSQITRKNLDIQPTLKILAGRKVNVLVNKDMILTPYGENS